MVNMQWVIVWAKIISFVDQQGSLQNHKNKMLFLGHFALYQQIKSLKVSFGNSKTNWSALEKLLKANLI